MKNESYFDNRDKTNLERIENICSQLPDFVEDFFLSIQMRTTTLTRLNYANDLHIFFDFLVQKKFKKVGE